MKKLFFLLSFLVLSFASIEAHTSYGDEDIGEVNSLDESVSVFVVVDLDSQDELIYTYKNENFEKPCTIQAPQAERSTDILKEADAKERKIYESINLVLEPPVTDLNCLNYKSLKLRTNMSTSSGGLPRTSILKK